MRAVEIAGYFAFVHLWLALRIALGAPPITSWYDLAQSAVAAVVSVAIIYVIDCTWTYVQRRDTHCRWRFRSPIVRKDAP